MRTLRGRFDETETNAYRVFKYDGKHGVVSSTRSNEEWRRQIHKKGEKNDGVGGNGPRSSR